MLRSLWSGVSGMQAHQIALDVESNNISNVNTVGFKYSRASFVDMLSQIKQIAASPYKNGLGGQNDYSIGLGVGVDATTKVFSQGNTQNTDIKTDIAIEGDGFFIVSPDRGITHNYTRNGEFLFDANGNLVNTGGYVVQGWIRGELENVEYMTEDDFFKVDHTGPIRNIQIDPAMVMPAKASSSISLRANLNAGRRADNGVAISALDSSTKTEVNPEIPIYDSANKLKQISYDMGAIFNADYDALGLKENQGIWISYQVAQMRQAVTPSVDTSSIGINGEEISFKNDSNITGISTIVAAQNAINAHKDKTGVEAFVDNGLLRLENQNTRDGDAKTKNILITKGGTGALSNFNEGDSVVTAFSYQYTKSNDADSTSGQFRTTEDLRALMQQDANLVKNPQTQYSDSTASVLVKVNDYGMFEMQNNDDGDDVKNNLHISVSSFYNENVTNNVLFKEAMAGIATTSLVEGGNSTSTGVFVVANHATSVDVVDSLGSKHTLRFEFYKTGDSEWSFRAILPEPAQFIGGSPTRPNIFEGGSASFNSDGSLAGMNPPVLQFDPKNGSTSPQRIELSFGDNGTFGGLTSVDRISETYTISDNGYIAGDLVDIRFDANGTLLGAFSNGKSLALAQVALANFSNNAGLQAEGGNIYSQSGNSGDPIVGAPNTGRRGGVSGSKLEMSNVDLSRALTQLIVVQRGFQANSKAVTTSDQILNTLLGLKQ
ncbi:flagellar hook protein FlgE [Helicobacter sp. MIT 14-3879]|uniref:flagellar hook protein FlgE n=1 Tax=Helicobacter sp. MIT 14-3879 TaxID=2040649 RepID=UPI000E1E8767|nr:flagellar hook protein FlgE [Helicobacter sp. MIT 14-3879]RDU65560.1 flagellar hook protein FlgE [Helicobacter sp. MIT 14-3879]